jgi:hypothetical protein
MLLLLWCTQGATANTVVLTDNREDFLIPASHLMVYTDTLQTCSIQALPENLFVPYASAKISSRSDVWFRFSITNHSQLRHWYLQVPLHSESVEVYFGHSSQYQVHRTGQWLAFESRPVQIRTLVFDLPLQEKDTLEVFVKLRSEKHEDASFILSAQARYLEVHTKGYFFMGLIYGVLFLMGIYNLLLFLSIREKIYLYYVLYVVSAIFFLSWKDGIGFQFLWPEVPSINRYHHAAGLFLLVNALFLYAASFLELREKYPLAAMGTYLILGSNLLYFLFHIFRSSYFDPLPLPYLLGYLYFLVLTGYSLYKRYRPSLYLLITLACTLSALLIIKMRYLGWLEWNWFIEYILNYTVVVDAIAMSLAIRDKIAHLRQQQEKAKTILWAEERLKSENQLFQLRNEYLEKEVQYKNDELALLGTHLAQKTEYFLQLKKELENLHKELPQQTALKKILKDVERGSEFDDFWEQFQLNFDKVHHNILSTLRDQYPQLKPTDLLFCAYVVINKSNKEIASLLNITVSGVEKRHLRLKEKLSIPKELSLSEYLLHLKKSAKTEGRL